MAESGTGPTPSLAEQWSLPPSEEQPAKEVVVEKASETPAAEKTDEAPIANQADETPGTEKTDERPVVAKAEEAPPVENTEDSTAKTDENPSSEEGAETPVEEQPEEEEATEEKPTIKIETAPADFRFPTTNQTRHCFTRYIEYHRCIQAKGEDAQECEKFAKYYRSLCPNEWIERWNEQRENGTFPGPL